MKLISFLLTLWAVFLFCFVGRREALERVSWLLSEDFGSSVIQKALFASYMFLDRLIICFHEPLWVKSLRMCCMRSTRLFVSQWEHNGCLAVSQAGSHNGFLRTAGHSH